MCCLVSGELAAKGYNEESPNTLGDIPASIWPDLQLRPPHAYDARDLASRPEPWTNIRIESADVKRLWRGLDEVRDRSLYDWDEVRVIFESFRAENDDWSQNKCIEKTRDKYAAQNSSRCPGVSTIKRRLKNWT